MKKLVSIVLFLVMLSSSALAIAGYDFGSYTGELHPWVHGFGSTTDMYSFGSSLYPIGKVHDLAIVQGCGENQYFGVENDRLFIECVTTTPYEYTFESSTAMIVEDWPTGFTFTSVK